MPRKKLNSKPSSEVLFSCPGCAGVLSLDGKGGGDRRMYRCQVGHRYSVRSLLEAKEIEVERMLWAAAVVLHHVTDVHDCMLKELPKAANEVRRRLHRRSREAKQQKRAVIRIIESTHACQ